MAPEYGMSPPDSLFPIVLVVLFGAAAGYLLGLSRIFTHLKKYHVQVWINLGRPSLPWGYSSRTAWLFPMFALGLRYRGLKDRALNRLFGLFWTSFCVMAVAAVIAFSMISADR